MGFCGDVASAASTKTPSIKTAETSTTPARTEATPESHKAGILPASAQRKNAKTVDGFPPNYMPPYVLKDLEYQSLVLYIQSLAKGE